MELIQKLKTAFQQEGFIGGIKYLKGHLVYRTYKLSNNRFIKKRILNFKMYLDINDTGLSKVLLIRGSREKAHTWIMKNILKPNMVVLDIGSNLGYYAIMEAKIAKKVYAIEPSPLNIKILRKNICLNKLNNVETYELAVSNKIGTRQLYLSNYSNYHSIKGNYNSSLNSFYAEESSGESIEVKTNTVDRFLKNKQKVDLIRMDIEGAECEVIDGMKETLKTFPMLMMEIHQPNYDNKNDFEKRIKKLFKQGYYPKYVVSEIPILDKEIEPITTKYTPIRIFKTDSYFRSVFDNITKGDLLELIIDTKPRRIKHILLCKENDILPK